MVVKVLGTGCKKCLTLEAKVKEIIEKNGIDATVEKVASIDDIISYGVMMTPGLVVNEKVKSSGIIPSDDKILTWLKEG